MPREISKIKTDDRFTNTFFESGKWKVLKMIHDQILSIGKETSYIIYPIYIKYFNEDRVIATVFLKSAGKHMDGVKNDHVDLGVNLSEKPKIKGFRTAEYMKDQYIHYSILLKNSDSPELIQKIVKLLK